MTDERKEMLQTAETEEMSRADGMNQTGEVKMDERDVDVVMENRENGNIETEGAGPESLETEGTEENVESGKPEPEATEENMGAGKPEVTEENVGAGKPEPEATEESVEAENLESEGAEGNGEAESGQETDSLAYIEHLLDERIVRAVREMGFERLTPIQEQSIPYLLEGEDIIGQAQTGTGKTAAFAIPALQKIDPDSKKLQTIILCPTRELAMQAADEIRHIAKYMHGIKVLPVYGGQDISRQIRSLPGVQIIVGTPGRVMDHMRRKTIKLDDVNMVVLDEADEMLNMGFREDMELILGQIPNEHQTALFSATMPKPILDITNQFQKDARMVKVAAQELTIPLVSQSYYRVKRQDKDAACVRLLEYYQPKLCLIFCNTKVKVDELAEVLKKAGFQAEGLHGDMSQHQRDVAMGRFRNSSTNILIATDVAARGIDVDDVEIVINYDIPQDIEYYVHRIGRTGRAGKTGRSFTFASARELHRIRSIERVCHTMIEEKKLPGASKVLKAKAVKYLDKAWDFREHEDIGLMKKYLQRKIEEEGCDILELAAAMLKYQVGDRGPELDADNEEPRGEERGRRRRRRGDRGEGRSERRRDEKEESRSERRSRDKEESRSERRRGEKEESRSERRRDEKEESRSERRSREKEESRSERRSREKEESRSGRRSRDKEESRSERRSREKEESRSGRRGRDREESRDRESRRSERRQSVWEDSWNDYNGIGYEDSRDSRRKDGQAESREERRKREHESSREERRRIERENGREERRKSDSKKAKPHKETRDERRKREKEEKRRLREGRSPVSRVLDVRMDGSEKNIAFTFPKKKKK